MKQDIKALYAEREKLFSDQTEESQQQANELTREINERLDAEIKRLTQGKEAPPEMTSEGQKNTLIFLLSDPDPDKVKNDIEHLQALSCKPEEVKGWAKLTPEEQATLTKDIIASNYLLALALTVLEKEAPGSSTGLYKPYAGIPPVKTAISNTLVANKLIAIEEAAKRGSAVTVSPDKGGKGAYKVITFMDYDAKNIAISGKPLTPYDKAVHSAISALYAAGNPYFTLQQAYRALTGGDVTDFRPETLKPLQDSIEAGITKRLKIDATEQLANYKTKGKVKKVIFENYFLPLKKIIVKMNNGEQLEAYAFLDAPPLYEYSRSLNQVIAVDMGLLDTRKQLRNSPEVVTIKEYLIKRIEGMKNNNNSLFNSKIRYDAIFREAGINTSGLDKTQLKRKREAVKKILSHFIEEHYIKNATEYKEGRSLAGISIEL